ncbi:MAG: hypothetical protein LBR49_08120 [Tannerella sp.]|nr:hypothetical protein [Tannerella sp.]
MNKDFLHKNDSRIETGNLTNKRLSQAMKRVLGCVAAAAMMLMMAVSANAADPDTIFVGSSTTSPLNIPKGHQIIKEDGTVFTGNINVAAGATLDIVGGFSNVGDITVTDATLNLVGNLTLGSGKKIIGTDGKSITIKGEGNLTAPGGIGVDATPNVPKSITIEGKVKIASAVAVGTADVETVSINSSDAGTITTINAKTISLNGKYTVSGAITGVTKVTIAGKAADGTISSTVDAETIEISGGTISGNVGSTTGKNVTISGVAVLNGTVAATENISISGKDVKINQTVTAGKNVTISGGTFASAATITATAGDITISGNDTKIASNIVATAGNIKISNGEITTSMITPGTGKKLEISGGIFTSNSFTTATRDDKLLVPLKVILDGKYEEAAKSVGAYKIPDGTKTVSSGTGYVLQYVYLKAGDVLDIETDREVKYSGEVTPDDTVSTGTRTLRTTILGKTIDSDAGNNPPDWVSSYDDYRGAYWTEGCVYKAVFYFTVDSTQDRKVQLEYRGRTDNVKFVSRPDGSPLPTEMTLPKRTPTLELEILIGTEIPESMTGVPTAADLAIDEIRGWAQIWAGVEKVPGLRATEDTTVLRGYVFKSAAHVHVTKIDKTINYDEAVVITSSDVNGLYYAFAKPNAAGEYHIIGEYKEVTSGKKLTGDDYPADATVIYVKRQGSCDYVTYNLVPDGGSVPGGQPRQVLLPAVEGITGIDKPLGYVHYTTADKPNEFTFTVNTGGKKVIVTADNGAIVADPVKNADGTYTVTVKNITKQPTTITVKFDTSAEVLEGAKVWSSAGQLYVSAVKAGAAKVYSISGALIKSIAVAAGETSATALPSGFYIVTLDGKATKVAVE